MEAEANRIPGLCPPEILWGRGIGILRKAADIDVLEQLGLHVGKASLVNG